MHMYNFKSTIMDNVKFIVCFYLCFSFHYKVIGQTAKDLNVPLVEQADSKWCWSASLEMLFKFHTMPKDTLQCHIASTHYRIKPFPVNRICNCTSYCTNSTINCSQAIIDSDLLRLLNNYNYNSWRINSPLTIKWDTVKLKIDKLRPFIISHVMGGCNSTHYLVAKGYCEKSTCNYVLVNDPSICKSQNIVAVRFNSSTSFKICSATLDNLQTSTNVNNAVNLSSNTCANILNCNIADIRLRAPAGLQIRSSANQTVLDSAYASINVEYIKIQNNKIVKVNNEPIRDIITGNVLDSANYVINRATKVDSVWEIQMVLRGKYKGVFDLDKTLSPTVTIGDNTFTLDRGLYKKVVLLPDYEDYLQFKYNKQIYFYPLNNCTNCNPQSIKRKDLIKNYYNTNSLR